MVLILKRKKERKDRKKRERRKKKKRIIKEREAVWPIRILIGKSGYFTIGSFIRKFANVPLSFLLPAPLPPPLQQLTCHTVAHPVDPRNLVLQYQDFWPYFLLLAIASHGGNTNQRNVWRIVAISSGSTS